MVSTKTFSEKQGVFKYCYRFWVLRSRKPVLLIWKRSANGCNTVRKPSTSLFFSPICSWSWYFSEDIRKSASRNFSKAYQILWKKKLSSSASILNESRNKTLCLEKPWNNFWRNYVTRKLLRKQIILVGRKQFPEGFLDTASTGKIGSRRERFHPRMAESSSHNDSWNVWADMRTSNWYLLQNVDFYRNL